MIRWRASSSLSKLDRVDSAHVRNQTPTLEQGRSTPGLVSVIVPCYNYAHYLRDCVGSALHRQQNVQVEVVIVDDCSTDSTERVCQELAAEDSRVRHHRNERDVGTISMSLHFFRNLLAIQDPVATTLSSVEQISNSTLQSELICTMARSHVLETILMLANSAESREFGQWNASSS